MKKIINYTLLLLSLTLAGCQKGFLDVKPVKSLLVPTTADDLWALLDNNMVFNNTSGLLLLADGDSYTTDAGYNAYFVDEERKTYTWAADIFGNSTEAEWNLPYQQVFYANVVLEGADKLPAGTARQTADAIKGTALFHRAFAYYNLTQEFAPAYHAQSAASAPGLPLKLSSDISQRPPRAPLEDTYLQMLQDLAGARKLLPLTTAYKTRPQLPAVYALYAKVYLAMENYAQAGKYADSCLQLSPALINYNTLSATATRPFVKALPNSNDEIIFYATAITYDFQSSASVTLADPALYQSYAANDLRKTIFFRALAPGFKFKGNYAGIISIFTGIATDEVYLIRAECNARLGNTAAAMADLNTLLVKRWKTNTYVQLTAASADIALALVLTERRKELTFRGTRWTDLRRLNPDPKFSVTLTRTIGGQTYMLAPDSKRYVYPIPLDELTLGNLAQNDR